MIFYSCNINAWKFNWCLSVKFGKLLLILPCHIYLLFLWPYVFFSRVSGSEFSKQIVALRVPSLRQGSKNREVLGKCWSVAVRKLYSVRSQRTKCIRLSKSLFSYVFHISTSAFMSFPLRANSRDYTRCLNEVLQV